MEFERERNRYEKLQRRGGGGGRKKERGGREKIKKDKKRHKWIEKTKNRGSIALILSVLSSC